MAYVKHVWQAREGTGLNKFTNTGTATDLVLFPNPDSVTQEGTPFSATWMNEMEQGIADGQVLVFDGAPTGTAAVGQAGVDISASPAVLYIYTGSRWLNLSAAGIYLTAAGAEALGLPENASVEDALQKLNTAVSEVDKIGDIKTTVRTDLGANWLLCNGDVISYADYPDLAPLLASQAFALNSRVDVGTPRANIAAVAKNENTIVAVGSGYASPYASYAYRSEDGGQTWTQVQITSASFTFSSIIWDGSQFVAFGVDARGTAPESTASVWTSPDGVTWTKTATDIFAAQGYQVASGNIIFTGENYVAIGWSSLRGAFIAVSQNLITWTSQSIIGQSAYDSARLIAYYNGVYYAVCRYYYSGSGQIYFLKSSDLTSWERQNVPAGAATPVFIEMSSRGVMLICTELGNVVTTKTGVISLFSPTPEGPYTLKTAYSGSCGADSALAVGGTYLVVSSDSTTSRLLTIDDPVGGTWQSQEIAPGTYGRANTVALINGGAQILAVGDISNTQTSAYLPRCWVFDATGTLPTISVNGAYAYIKAKEKEAST